VRADQIVIGCDIEAYNYRETVSVWFQWFHGDATYRAVLALGTAVHAQ
jgi:hypothetical protein